MAPNMLLSEAACRHSLVSDGLEWCRYNNGRFYLLVDGPAAVAPWKMTRNQDLNVLHVDDATQWAAPLDARVVSGDTLIFDFVYFLHPVSVSLSAQPATYYWKNNNITSLTVTNHNIHNAESSIVSNV